MKINSPCSPAVSHYLWLLTKNLLTTSATISLSSWRLVFNYGDLDERTRSLVVPQSIHSMDRDNKHTSTFCSVNSSWGQLILLWSKSLYWTRTMKLIFFFQIWPIYLHFHLQLFMQMLSSDTGWDNVSPTFHIINLTQCKYNKGTDRQGAH